MDHTDVFQSFEALSQDQWTLPKLLQIDSDDDLPYLAPTSSGSSASHDLDGRRRVEYLANKLNISPGLLIAQLVNQGFFYTGLIAKFHYTDTDTDTDFFVAKFRWVRAGRFRRKKVRVRVRVVEFSFK